MNVHLGCWEALGRNTGEQDLFAFLNCHSSCHGYQKGSRKVNQEFLASDWTRHDAAGDGENSMDHILIQKSWGDAGFGGESQNSRAMSTLS